MTFPKYFKSINDKLKNIDVWGERNFRRDWKTVLITGLVIVVITSVFIGYFSKLVMVNLAKIKPSARTVLTIDRGAMDKIVDFYKNQEQLFRGTKINVADPSK